MSYKTLEVELDAGRITPCGKETLPAKAHALLTILQPNNGDSGLLANKSGAGLHRFLSSPNFKLTPEQFHVSMGADFFEQ